MNLSSAREVLVGRPSAPAHPGVRLSEQRGEAVRGRVAVGLEQIGGLWVIGYRGEREKGR